MGPSMGRANGSWRARGSNWDPMATPWPPHYFWGSPHLALCRQLFAFWRETFLGRHHRVNATMATLEAGKGNKGKNFNADEERPLCRSYLVVLPDLVCGNGQRNTAFWERITTNYNHNKPRSCRICLARSLESKWSHIKHDVAKFSGVFKQVSNCREFGASAEDVLEKTLEFYKDRQPKQQGFAFLHCWHLFKEVPRWWQSAQDIQRRGSGGGGASPVGNTAEQLGGGSGDKGEACEEEEVQVVARPNFPNRSTRPQGSKAAKAYLYEQNRRDLILKIQALVMSRWPKQICARPRRWETTPPCLSFKCPLWMSMRRPVSTSSCDARRSWSGLSKGWSTSSGKRRRKSLNTKNLSRTGPRRRTAASDFGSNPRHLHIGNPNLNPSPNLSPTVTRSDSTPRPPPTAEEDSPVHIDLGE